MVAIILLFSCLLVFGAVITVLSSGQSNQTFSFTGAGTQTGYFSIPLDANVTSASMSLQGQTDFDVNYAWDINGETKFDTGTYLSTDYNSLDANGFVGLTLGNNAGDYNSVIFDANTIADWNALKWDYKKYNCPTGMAFIAKLGGFCIDQYEASHSDATFCANSTTWSGGCSSAYGSLSTPASVPNRIPWTTVSQTAASTACLAAGKYLCSSAEWMAAANLNGQVYDLSDATTQTTCIVDSTLYCLDHSDTSGEACNTGSNKTTSPSNCKSSQGVYDLIGNVWEWTSDVVDVNTSAINGWQYPNDSTNPPLWGNLTKSSHYGNDGVYGCAAPCTGRAVLRGGRWGHTSYAGLFCVYLSYDPTYAYSSIGFRCCKKS